MSQIIEMLPNFFMIVGVLAFVVSVIIEVIKNVGPLKNVPTDLVVILLSIVLTVVAFMVYLSVEGLALMWYWVVGAIIGGFFVAFVAMYGWSKLTELYNRFKK